MYNLMMATIKGQNVQLLATYKSIANKFNIVVFMANWYHFYTLCVTLCCYTNIPGTSTHSLYSHTSFSSEMVKLSLYKPGQGSRIPEGWGTQNFYTISTLRRQGCQPYTPAAFTLRRHRWYSFMLDANSNAESQCGQKVNEKSQMTPMGTEPTTSWLIV
jgi:hypothetical protein